VVFAVFYAFQEAGLRSWTSGEQESEESTSELDETLEAVFSQKGSVGTQTLGVYL
jgi:hypothetical protein